jgi:hypothetical protein
VIALVSYDRVILSFGSFAPRRASTVDEALWRTASAQMPKDPGAKGLPALPSPLPRLHSPLQVPLRAHSRRCSSPRHSTLSKHRNVHSAR